MNSLKYTITFVILFLTTMPAAHAQKQPKKAVNDTILFSIQNATSPKAPNSVVESSIKTLAVRLLPGMDVKEELEQIVKEYHIGAASVLTCVGSLRNAVVRFAGKPNGVELHGPLEIVSLTGTLGQDGSHLHIALSDSNGTTIGGHVLSGCKIFTTAEIVLCVLTDAIFSRELDTASGYKELIITAVSGKK